VRQLGTRKDWGAGARADAYSSDVNAQVKVVEAKFEKKMAELNDRARGGQFKGAQLTDERNILYDEMNREISRIRRNTQ
jgi:hypothetical protein